MSYISKLTIKCVLEKEELDLFKCKLCMILKPFLPLPKVGHIPWLPRRRLMVNANMVFHLEEELLNECKKRFSFA